MDKPPKQVWVYWDSRFGKVGPGQWRSTTVKPEREIAVVGPYTIRPKKRKATEKRSTTK